MESETERKNKREPAQDGAPIPPDTVPADEDVDACISERLHPDGTAAWFPRPAGLGFGVPEAVEAAPADGASRNGPGESAAWRPLADARPTAAGRAPNRGAAVAAGHTAGHGAPAPAEGGIPSLRAASIYRWSEATAPGGPDGEFMRAVAARRAESRMTRAFGPETGDAENPVPAPANTRPGSFPAVSGHLRVMESGLTAGDVRPVAECISVAEPDQTVLRNEEGRIAGYGRNAPEWPGVFQEFPVQAEGYKYPARVAGERWTTRASGPNAQFSAFPAARCGAALPDFLAGGPEARVRSAAEFSRAVRRVREMKAEAANAGMSAAGDPRDARTAAGLKRDSRLAVRADDAAAPVTYVETHGDPARRAAHFSLSALDIHVLALGEEKTLQAEDGASTWRAGLPDLSGVVLGEGGRNAAEGSGRAWTRSSVPAAPVPEHSPSVQVTATLRVDEEELVCAVERLATRQALRG